jgi:hypothetical protein
VLPAGTWVTLRHRPALPEGGFGDERQVTVRLAMLDTGSSRDGVGDDARLASRADRRLARQQFVARWSHEPREGDAATWSRTAPDGAELRAFAAGDRLSLQIRDLVLVQDADGGFARENGEVRELTLEERERLRRERLCNPMLWPRQEIATRLADALLLGGVHVHGAPALRFELPGDGECEAWFFHDGSPAGFAFRDPIRRATVAWYVRGDTMRVVVDGALEPGWQSGARTTGDADERWFRRDS